MNIINDTLSFSQKERKVIRIYTTLPDWEKFDGIILNYSDEIVCFYSIYDFAFNGIVILSK
jgi:hypothetical protein